MNKSVSVRQKRVCIDRWLWDKIINLICDANIYFDKDREKLALLSGRPIRTTEEIRWQISLVMGAIIIEDNEENRKKYPNIFAKELPKKEPV